MESFKHFQQAREDYLQVLKLKPDRLETRCKLGALALADGANYSDAELYFRQVVEKDPLRADAWQGIARCRQGLGDAEGAFAAARKVMEILPEHGETLLLLGELAIEEDQPQKSLEWLERAEKTDVDQQQLQHLFVQVLHRLGRAAEADRHNEIFQRYQLASAKIEEVLANVLDEPDEAQYPHELGLLYRELGNDSVAEQWFLSALHRDPTFLPSHEELAELYSRSSDSRVRAQGDSHSQFAKTAKKAKT
jgi:tetratricopeptide (TPR) repeat protein